MLREHVQDVSLRWKGPTLAPCRWFNNDALVRGGHLVGYISLLNVGLEGAGMFSRALDIRVHG